MKTVVKMNVERKHYGNWKRGEYLWILVGILQRPQFYGMKWPFLNFRLPLTLFSCQTLFPFHNPSTPKLEIDQVYLLLTVDIKPASHFSATEDVWWYTGRWFLSLLIYPPPPPPLPNCTLVERVTNKKERWVHGVRSCPATGGHERDKLI